MLPAFHLLLSLNSEGECDSWQISRAQRAREPQRKKKGKGSECGLSGVNPSACPGPEPPPGLPLQVQPGKMGQTVCFHCGPKQNAISFSLPIS